MFHSQQFGFQKVHSTEHAFDQLVDQIYKSFGNDNCTAEVFVDLLKTFHTILLKKIEI